MKKYLAIAAAAIALAASTPAMADKGRHYRDHGKTVIINNYGHPRHYKDHHRSSRHHGYKHPRYSKHYRYSGPPVVHQHYYKDDSYKWIGGVYILNEILHHNHH